MNNSNWKKEFDRLTALNYEQGGWDIPYEGNYMSRVKEWVENLLDSDRAEQRKEIYETGYKEGQDSKIQDWVIDIEEFENPEAIKTMLVKAKEMEKERLLKEIDKIIYETSGVSSRMWTLIRNSIDLNLNRSSFTHSRCGESCKEIKTGYYSLPSDFTSLLDSKQCKHNKNIQDFCQECKDKDDEFEMLAFQN